MKLDVRFVNFVRKRIYLEQLNVPPMLKVHVFKKDLNLKARLTTSQRRIKTVQSQEMVNKHQRYSAKTS